VLTFYCLLNFSPKAASTKPRTMKTSSFERVTDCVLAVLATLVFLALVVPKIAGRSGERSDPNQTKESTLAGCLHQFKLDCGRYPTTKEGLEALISCPPGLEGKAKEPYIVNTNHGAFVDTWGNPFLYRSPRTDGRQNTFRITSYGPTGQPDGVGEDSPIVDSE
jgi:general secretion pathway protein G